MWRVHEAKAYWLNLKVRARFLALDSDGPQEKKEVESRAFFITCLDLSRLPSYKSLKQK